jgi:hypothetical protein
MTRSGWLTVTDALLVAPWDDATAGELPPYRRVPRDRRAAHVLLRTARCSHGFVELAFECDPVFDYGARRGTWSRDGDRTAWVRHPDGGVELSLTGDLRLGIDGDRVRARTVLRDGHGGHVVVARDTGGRAQLGLPLHLDPGRRLHPLGALHLGLRRRGERR